LEDRPSYSNFGFSLLGHVLGKIADQKFEQYVKDFILEPLGMDNTGYDFTNEIEKKMAVGYLGSYPIPNFDLGWERPAGQMYSTVNDLAKLMQLIFRDSQAQGSTPNQILDGQTIKEWMLPKYVTGNDGMGIQAIGVPWEMNLANPYWIVAKDGDVLGFSALFSAIPQLKYGVIVQVNTMGPASAIVEALHKTLIPAFESVLSTLQVPPPLPDNYQDYFGFYQVPSSITNNFPPPFTGLQITAVVNTTSDWNGTPRMSLFISSPLTTDYAFIDWQEDLGVFQRSFMQQKPSCPGLLGGENQYVVFNGTKSFTVPGLYYGFIWEK